MTAKHRVKKLRKKLKKENPDVYPHPRYSRPSAPSEDRVVTSVSLRGVSLVHEDRGDTGRITHIDGIPAEFVVPRFLGPSGNWTPEKQWAEDIVLVTYGRRLQEERVQSSFAPYTATPS